MSAINRDVKLVSHTPKGEIINLATLFISSYAPRFNKNQLLPAPDMRKGKNLQQAKEPLVLTLDLYFSDYLLHYCLCGQIQEFNRKIDERSGFWTFVAFSGA